MNSWLASLQVVCLFRLVVARDAKEIRENKIAARNPMCKKSVSLSPLQMISAAIFFFGFFSRVTHDEGSDRGTTHSLNSDPVIEFCVYIYLAETKAFPLVLVLGFSGAALLVLLLTVVLLVRHHRGKYLVAQKRREAQKRKETELEMEVQQPGNDVDVNPAVNIFYT